MTISASKSFPIVDDAIDTAKHLYRKARAIDYKARAAQARHILLTTLAWCYVIALYTAKAASWAAPRLATLLRYLAQLLDTVPEVQAPALPAPPAPVPTRAIKARAPRSTKSKKTTR